MKNGYSNDSLHPPRYQQSPPFHPFRPDNRGCIDNAFAVLALPLPIDTPTIRGPYHRGSMGWRQFDPKYQHQEMFKLSDTLRNFFSTEIFLVGDVTRKNFRRKFFR